MKNLEEKALELSIELNQVRLTALLEFLPEYYALNKTPNPDEDERWCCFDTEGSAPLQYGATARRAVQKAVVYDRILRHLEVGGERKR
jgi:hypothetical protein